MKSGFRAWPLLGFLGCIALTIWVQDGLRPALAGRDLDTAASLIIATAPSFLYALGGVLGVASVIAWPPSYRWWALPGPAAYELLQPWIDGRTFDLADLVASLLGGLLAILMTARSGRTDPALTRGRGSAKGR